MTITAEDWPRYCGLNGNREIAETQCSFDWANNPPQELWRHPVDDAWSSFSIVGNRLYTQEQRGLLECVVCYDADTWNVPIINRNRLYTRNASEAVCYELPASDK